MSTPLPIEPVLPALASALETAGVAVLQAPPGAGKTTRVPLALLDRPWLQGGILMLEPRRLAARAAARRMAAMLGERLGQRVGYRIRRDVVVGRETRVEVVTEGILTRMLQSDPGLARVGLIVFDEFHERNLQGDLGLALALQTRALLRPDLRVLVMSATLEGEPVARLLGDAPIVTSEGRSFPVETRYLPPRPGGRIEPAVAAAVRQALADDAGDLLVFLPGAGEIRRTGELLQDLAGGPVSVIPLHGSLTGEEQDRAILPSPPGRRKVVLATSIAETSLTIEGVGVVIDAGLARVPRFSPATGMTRLATVRVSRSSADQRRGRAGRTGPGVCYRLWPAREEHHLLSRPTPEILEADLAPLALELAVSGAEPAELAWLDPPPAAALSEGRALLRQLGAVDAGGRVTPHGRRMAELGAHPRLAHMLLAGQELGAGHLATRLAAILEERDFLRGEAGPPDPDLQLRLDLAGARETPAAFHGHGVDRATLHRVRQEAQAWARQLGAGPPGPEAPGVSAGLLLALAYPDRIARRREGQAGRFLLRNGQGAETAAPSLALSEYLVAAQLDGDRRESRIWLGAPVELEELLSRFAGQVEHEELVTWPVGEPALKAIRRERLGALVLAERSLRDPDPGSLTAVVLDYLRREGLGILTWSGEATRLRERIGFVARLARGGDLPGSWPDVSDAALLQAAESWLGNELAVIRRRSDFATIDVAASLAGLLSWEARRALDQLAPTHLTVPSGSSIRVEYGGADGPVLAVRLQEVFGLTETPRVGGGRVPVTVHLLSPAGRPVQVTRDLAGFWRTSYFDVRKEMKGRYPRHHWPDDPLQAEPTRRAKPKGR